MFVSLLACLRPVGQDSVSQGLLGSFVNQRLPDPVAGPLRGPQMGGRNLNFIRLLSASDACAGLTPPV